MAMFDILAWMEIMGLDACIPVFAYFQSTDLPLTSFSCTRMLRSPARLSTFNSAGISSTSNRLSVRRLGSKSVLIRYPNAAGKPDS